TAAVRERQTAEKPLQQALAAVGEATQKSESLTRSIDASGEEQIKLATSARQLQSRIDAATATLAGAKKEAEAVPVVTNLAALRLVTQTAEQDREFAAKTAKTVEADLAEATRKAEELQRQSLASKDEIEKMVREEARHVELTKAAAAKVDQAKAATEK